MYEWHIGCYIWALINARLYFTAFFTVTIASNNSIILQNVHWPGLHIGTKGKKATVFVSIIIILCQSVCVCVCLCVIGLALNSGTSPQRTSHFVLYRDWGCPLFRDSKCINNMGKWTLWPWSVSFGTLECVLWDLGMCPLGPWNVSF